MQVNQNVNASNFLLIGNQAGNYVSGDSSVSTGSFSADSKNFASFLEEANDNQLKQNARYVETKQDVCITDKEDSVESVKEQPEQQECTVNDTKKTEESKDTDIPEKTEESINMADSKNDDDSVQGAIGKMNIEMPEIEFEDLSEENLTIILETISNLLQNIMKQFDLNVEEFSAKLEEFGMELSDLLSQSGLKDFFLQMNNAEPSDLVVDENLNLQLNLFMDECSEELKTMESLVSNADTVLQDDDVKMLLHDFFNTEQDNFQMKVDAEPEVEIAKEPEVIFTNNTSHKESDSDSYDNRQSDGTVKQMVPLETSQTENHDIDNNVFENPILQALHNAVERVEASMIPEQPIQQTDVIRQVVEQVRLNMNQQTTSLELQLYPEHLGRIQINVVSKEGVMTASIVAETETAKQAIEGGLFSLKEAMQQQDLKVEAIEVMVSTMGFEKGDEQQNSFEENRSSNARRRIDLTELNEDVSTEDDAEIEKMIASGSSVSYTA